MKQTISPAAFDTAMSAVEDNQIGELSPLSLAYIGDTVYDLFVRGCLVKNRRGGISQLHKQASSLVNARAQAQAARKLEPLLAGSEADVFRRGKNAKSTPPKNASVADYRYATAIEALIGYLYLTGRTARLTELMRAAITTEDKDA